MAKTFAERISSLTGLPLTETTRPSLDDVTQFLKDGQRDISNRLKILDPGSLVHISTTTTGTDDITIPSGIVLQVERENGNSGVYVKATPLDSSLKNEATRITSIHYQSAHHPVFYIQDNTLVVLPAAATTGGQTKITYIKFDDDVEHTSKSIDGYTDKYEDLLVHYVALRLLRNKLLDLAIKEEDSELVPVLIGTTDEVKTYYDQGFLSPQSLQQSQQQQPPAQGAK